MPNARLKKILQSVGDFPTLPAVVARAIQELGNPNSSAADLTEIISVDAAMTFRILKIANSAYYGFPRAITNVTESIVLLGFSTVRNLMLTTIMYTFDHRNAGSRKAGVKRAGFDQAEEWRHAVATALAVRELLHLLHQDALEHVGYLAGLMHDIGKILFHHYLPEEYAKVLALTHKEETETWQVEEAHLGAHHGQVGAWIVDRWNLPREIVAPIAFHHDPEKAPEQKELTRILSAGDHAARLARLAAPGEKAWWQVHEKEFTALNLTLEQIAPAAARIRQEISQIEQFMVQ